MLTPYVSCVAKGDHLGGIVQTGRRRNLQVRVEAGPLAVGEMAK